MSDRYEGPSREDFKAMIDVGIRLEQGETLEDPDLRAEYNRLSSMRDFDEMVELGQKLSRLLPKKLDLPPLAPPKPKLRPPRRFDIS
jgi:hypothetical protein